MAQESRLAGAVREVEGPLVEAMYANGFNDLGSPDLLLTNQVCCDASNLLWAYLNKQGFETKIKWRKTPKDLLPRDSIATPYAHVLLHERKEGVDSTYLQFLALAGLTHRLSLIPSLHAEIAKLFPERKIAVFRLGEAALFGDSVADFALQSRGKAKEILAKLESEEYALERAADPHLQGDIEDQTPLLDASEDAVRAFYAEVWNPAAYLNWSIQRQSKKYFLDAETFRAHYDAVVDSMK